MENKDTSVTKSPDQDNELIKFSEDGYFLNVVDCGKSPELINKIGLIINNQITCKLYNKDYNFIDSSMISYPD